jgi:hypothetical protein
VALRDRDELEQMIRKATDYMAIMSYEKNVARLPEQREKLHPQRGCYEQRRFSQPSGHRCSVEFRQCVLSEASTALLATT